MSVYNLGHGGAAASRVSELRAEPQTSEFCDLLIILLVELLML